MRAFNIGARGYHLIPRQARKGQAVPGLTAYLADLKNPAFDPARVRPAPATSVKRK